MRYVADVDEVHRRILEQRGRPRPAVLDLDSLERLWDPAGRGFTLTRFSPNGRLVLGETKDGLVVLGSRTGEERARIALPPGTSVQQTMWETDRSILIVVTLGQRMAVLRSTTRGRVEVAVPPMRDPHEFGPGIVLTERP